MPSNGEQVVVNGCFVYTFFFTNKAQSKHENLLLIDQFMWAWSIEHYCLGFVFFEHQS